MQQNSLMHSHAVHEAILMQTDQKKGTCKNTKAYQIPGLGSEEYAEIA